MRPPSEEADLRTAETWLAAHGLHVKRFPKPERKTGKTPDFRLFRDGQHVGFCEVKSPRDERLDDKLQAEADAEQSFKTVGVVGPTAAYNRISKHIDKAIEQFDAVNPDRLLPNILVFINWDQGSNYTDLHETLFGYHDYVDDKGRPTYRDNSRRKVAEGRIKDGKHRIDLYVWIDGRTQRANPQTISGDDTHKTLICGWLGIGAAGAAR
jgi:hypothetical protein